MTLHIPLNSEWVLVSDKNNFILARREGDKIIHEKFYQNLDNAINGFIQLKLRGYNANSLNSLSQSIKSLHNGFTELVTRQINLIEGKNE